LKGTQLLLLLVVVAAAVNVICAAGTSFQLL
jgi:hypothetical protein